jgi:hypothetical protein
MQIHPINSFPSENAYWVNAISDLHHTLSLFIVLICECLVTLIANRNGAAQRHMLFKDRKQLVFSRQLNWVARFWLSSSSQDNGGTSIVIAEDQIVATHASLNSVFQRIWPLACLVVALVVTVAWIGVLAYGFFRLIGTALF